MFLKGESWTTKVLHKDFGHCCVMRRDSSGWVVIDPNPNGLDIAHVEPEFFDNLLKDSKGNIKILKLTMAERVDKYMMKGLRFISCVSIAKYILGLTLPLTFTPRQLYCRLLGLPRGSHHKYGILSVDLLEE